MKNVLKISETRLGQEVKKPKKHWIRTTIIITLSTLFVALVSVGIQTVLQQNFITDLTTWTSSLPSYWGGIIGGVISGTISFLGVYLTIRYYRESDVTKNRIAHMPFINISIKRAECIKVLKEETDRVINYPGRLYEINKKDLVRLSLSLENIGNGFANTLVLHLGWNFGGESYKKLLKVGKTEHLELKFFTDDTKHLSNISFSIQYVDCMTNEYIQQYTINCKNLLIYPQEDVQKLIEIENGYPEFIGQIHQIEKAIEKDNTST